MASDNTTITQLMELYQQSRKSGEWVHLSLESKDGRDYVNFSISNPAGSSAGKSLTQSFTGPRRRKTPSQWKRDQRRKEEFIARKSAAASSMEESEPTNDQSLGNTKNKLVLHLKKQEYETLKPGLKSPISQVDGEAYQEENKTIKYTFLSEFGEEDILYSLEKLFPADHIVSSTTLVSRIRTKPLSAEHLCTVELMIPEAKQESFRWPDLKEDADVFIELKQILL